MMGIDNDLPDDKGSAFRLFMIQRQTNWFTGFLTIHRQPMNMITDNSTNFIAAINVLNYYKLLNLSESQNAKLNRH